MKTKIFTLITLLLFSVGVSAQIDRSQQPKPGPAPKIQLQTPVEYTLPNGLTVMIVENKKLPRVSYNLRIDNVPMVEGEKAGVSSILAAMLGNGTTNIAKDDFNEEVDFLGANMNFGSSGGFASGLSKYADRLMELMADAAINPLLVQEEYEKEKEKAIEGLKSSEKDVSTVANRVENALVYGTHHPFGEYVTEETLNAITLDDVKTFYTERFNPGNAYLVIIGDVNSDEIRKKVMDTFGLWIKGTSIDLGVTDALPNVQYKQINFIDMPNAVQSNVAVTNNIQLKMNDQDYHAALIANYILGGGGSAYLYQNLRESHGYTYGSYASLNASKYVGKFKAYAQVRNEVTDSSIVEIFNELKRIRTEPVSAEDLAKAKALYAGSFVRALERPQTIANYALNIKINNLPQDFYETYLEKINSVTADDVARVANKYFSTDNARVVVVGKGADILDGLEKTGIPIKYFDTYANPVDKPEYSKAIPDGVTAQSVINKYVESIGGKDRLMGVKTTHSTANVTIEGAPFKPTADIKKMAPNKESLEMNIEGMGTIMKQKFNGESGYVEQQGAKKEMSPEEIADKQSDSGIFPELNYDMANVSLESMTTIEGKDVFKVKVMNGDKSSFRFYDAETGYLVRVESSTEQQGQTITSVVDYSKYSPVNDVMFPYMQKVVSGPQTIVLNITNVKVNEGVSDEDFN